MRAVVRLENRGSDAVQLDQIQLLVDGHPLLPDSAWLSGPLAPGSALERDVSLGLAGDAGVRAWICAARWSGDLVPEDDADTLYGWVGPSPLRISEIAPRPRSGGTEWVELESAAGTVPVKGWSLRDAGGARLALLGGEPLPQGARVVVAHDSLAAVVTGFVPNPWVGAWPTLNDAATKGEGADTLWLANPAGLVTDWAVYGTTGAEETWIRLPGSPVDAGLDAWAVADGPTGGTPGLANFPAASTRSLPPESPGNDGEAISLQRNPGGAWIPLPPTLPGSRRVVRLLRFDGSAAGEFETAPGAKQSWARWDGRAPDGRVCPAGLYLLETRIIGDDGRPRTTRRPLVVGR